VQTKVQFGLVGTFARVVGRESRLTLQSNFGLIFHFVLTAAFYFHFYNICGYTS